VTDDGDESKLKVLFPSRDALSAFHDYCVSHDFAFGLERVYSADNPQEVGEYDVTHQQQEALEAAYDAGYFAVPRETTLTDLAGDLDISSNALSARLRRGHRNLLSNTLVHEE
jgi:predicted DNA binding protein